MGKTTGLLYNLFIDGPDAGEVRLYYTYYWNVFYTGRLEVFLPDVWGTVSGSWTKENAAVVCRQMGFESECNNNELLGRECKSF